jgi:hypothetical protein
MAVESDQIIADVVEISEFPDMAQRYAITGVPKIVINDQVELLGAQPESTFDVFGIPARVLVPFQLVSPKEVVAYVRTAPSPEARAP